ncbi:hypothetical protein WBK31_39425 [Nonomuraea sp. N2-4H]|uniref:hypothetical protein n=1 Tax=Nonomuraea sp. N2-4H TaxID=3128898 RepID=UPI003255B0EC
MRSKLAALILTAVTAGACVAATAAPAAATTSAYGKSKWISATKGWQHTGVYVEPGDLVRIRATDGRWTVDHRKFPYVSANGYHRYTDRKIYQGCKILRGLPYGTLIARVNGDHYRVGTRGVFRARQAGFLQLRVNDADGCLKDNDGTVIAKIRVSN